jgi:hypothetical protein
MIALSNTKAIWNFKDYIVSDIIGTGLYNDIYTVMKMAFHEKEQKYYAIEYFEPDQITTH